MAYKRRGGGGNDKYLRLTGLWPSKKDGMFSGKLRPEDVEKLMAKVEEAAENEAPIVFTLWENDKKESRKDPEFSLQCFVGDADEQPRSSRGGGGYRRQERDRDDPPSRRSRHDKEAPEDDEPEDEPEAEGDEEQEEPEERPARKKGKAEPAPKTKKKKSEADDSW